MRTRIFLAISLFLASWSVSAQDVSTEPAPFKKSFSLELGSGLQPLHMTLAPGDKERVAMANKGMVSISSNGWDCPVISISEVWRTRPHWELCLTEGISWKIMSVYQYKNTFGTSPDGKPRYDLTIKPEDAGRKASWPIGSLTFQARFIWSPKWKVTMYSAFGAGLTTATSFYPMPLLTPVAIRFKGEHFYVFAEATLGPVASFGHGGVGWRF